MYPDPDRNRLKWLVSCSSVGFLKFKKYIYKNHTTESLTYDHWNLQMQNQDRLPQWFFHKNHYWVCNHYLDRSNYFRNNLGLFGMTKLVSKLCLKGSCKIFLIFSLSIFRKKNRKILTPSPDTAHRILPYYMSHIIWFQFQILENYFPTYTWCLMVATCNSKVVVA